MSLPKYRALAVLGNYPHISPRELTDLTQMNKGQISRVVVELEKDACCRAHRTRRTVVVCCWR